MSINEEENQEKKEPIIKIRVSPDKMAAFISVGLPDNCREVVPEDLFSALEEEEVTFGINREDIKKRCNFQSFYNEFQCAQGIPPVAGNDGTMEFLFDKNPIPKPEVTSEGNADYHAMGIVQNVSEKQVLCRRTLPVPGKNGTNVFGAEVPFKAGKEYRFESGKNTVISDDTLELLAEIEGHVFYKNNKVEVNDTYTVRGDIDTATGDIVSSGNVVVMGDVREGFKIHAKKNVTVNGMVEGATIWAGGDINISQGMNGMNMGYIYCGGNIKSKYFQNSEIMCNGDVTAEYYLNGSVTSGANITAEGRRGVLLGGKYEAGNSIVAKTIGADTYLATEAGIVTNPDGFWNPELQKTDEEIMKELSKMSDEDREQWLAENVYVAPSAPEHAKIVASGIIYPGVKLTFGQWTKKLEEEYSNMGFHYNKEEQEIESFPA